MGCTLFSADSQLSVPAHEARTLSLAEEAEGGKERFRAAYHSPAARKLLWFLWHEELLCGLGCLSLL